MMNEQEIPGLKEAQAERAAAEEKITALAARQAAAETALAAARTARAAIVQSIAAGEAVPAEDAEAADMAVASAEREVSRLAAALALPNEGLKRADAKIAKARRRHALRQLVAEIKQQVALSEEADEIGLILAKWLTKWQDHKVTLHTAMSAAGRTDRAEYEALTNRYDIVAFLPRPIQNVIAQAGSIIEGYSVAKRHKGAFDGVLVQVQRELEGSS